MRWQLMRAYQWPAPLIHVGQNGLPLDQQQSLGGVQTLT